MKCLYFFLVTVFVTSLYGKVKDEGTFELKFQTMDHTVYEHSIPSNRVYLLSSRNSGSHFLSYIVQYLTKQVWQTPYKKYSFFKQCIDDKFNFIKVHQSDKKYLYNEPSGYFFTFDSKSDTLIFLIRSLKEIIFKHNKAQIYKLLLKEKLDEETLFRLINDFTQPMKNQKGRFIVEYFQNIETFLNWSKNNRIIIPYKDLILDVRKVFKALKPKLLTFSPNITLNKNTYDNATASFCKNIALHRDRCATLTRKFNCTSANPIHSYEYREEELYKKYSFLFDEILKKNYPKYFRFLKQCGCL